jgi:hypothetical protein
MMDNENGVGYVFIKYDPKEMEEFVESITKALKDIKDKKTIKEVLYFFVEEIYLMAKKDMLYDDIMRKIEEINEIE